MSLLHRPLRLGRQLPRHRNRSEHSPADHGGRRVPEYSRLRSPILALYAVYADTTSPFAFFAASERERFARALLAARVVAIRNSKHYLFFSHREEVLRELRGVLAALNQATKSP